MRKLSARAKALNEIAKANAHATQVMRLNDTLTAQKVELIGQNSALHDTIMVHAKARDRDERSIAAFKQETLALTIQAAELRGYIARVLEDDAASDAKDAPVPQQDCVVETRFMPRAVNDHQRTGPGAMHPPIYRDDNRPSGTAWDNYNHRDALERAATDRCASIHDPFGQIAPKHWTQR